MRNMLNSYSPGQNTNKSTAKIVLFRLTILLLVSMGFILVLQIISRDVRAVMVLALGMIPILFVLWLTRRGLIELAGTVIAISLVAIFTVLATNGQGAYDIGSVVFPSILVIASLILNRRTVIYLAGIIILCNAWLTLGAVYGLYQPTYPQTSQIGQFIVTSLILLITMVAVYSLSNMVRNSLTAAQKELSEREKAERALREAETMYRTLVEDTSVIIYRDAPTEDGATDYISPQIESLLGYSTAEWRDDPRIWRELTHPEDLPRVVSGIKEYLASGGKAVIEYRMKTKDDRWIWFQDESVVIRDDNGKPLYVHGVMIDITERKNAEQQVKQREAVLSAVAQTAQQLLKTNDWRTEIESILKQLGQAANASHVYVFENHAGQSDIVLSSLKYEWTAPGIKPELDNPTYQNTMLVEVPGIEDWFNNMINGKPFYGGKDEYPMFWERAFESTGLKTILDVPIYVDGKWWGIIGFDDFVNLKPWSQAETDALTAAASNLGTVIERQEADDALRASEAKFQIAFHYTFVPMSISRTSDNTILDVNRAFCEMTGYSRAETIGRTSLDLNLWKDLEEQGNFYNLLARQGHASEFKAEFRRKSGETGMALVSAVRISLGDEPCFLNTVYDISKIQQLLLELQAKNEELQNFTYTVSHDLKAPLVTISGFVGYLEQDARKGDMERVNKDVLRITEAVTKMQRLLNELLELSRIGRLVNASEEVPFAEIVQEALDTVEGRLQARQVRVKVEADLPSVYGDRVRLVEVIQNLVDNAAKYMGDQVDPVIKIGVGQVNGERVFHVSDNGLGLEPAHFERVFGLFNKLDAKTEGTGIGLALVKKIVEVHGGRVWVESDGIGKGSTFHFTLADRPTTGAK